MREIEIRNYRPEDKDALVALQAKSLAVCPDMDPTPGGFYAHPAFEQGSNIYCAVDVDGQLRGYGLVFNNPERAWFYMDIKADPEWPDVEAVKDQLLARVTERARSIAAGRRAARQSATAAQAEGTGAEGDTQMLLYGCYFSHGTASIDYLRSRGFQRNEPLSGYDLIYDLARAVDAFPIPEGVEIRQWMLDTEAEQGQYLEALNATFPNDRMSREGLRFAKGTPNWVTYAAFAGAELTGFITAHAVKQELGTISYLLVLPTWRRKGIAQALLAKTIRYLQARKIERVMLETGGDNIAAQNLYRSVGFEVRAGAISYSIEL